MADQPGKGKELLGQPWWVWAAGAAAIIGGYLYIKHKSATQSSTSGGPRPVSAAGPTKVGLTFTDLNKWMNDHQKPVHPKRGQRMPPSPPAGV